MSKRAGTPKTDPTSPIEGIERRIYDLTECDIERRTMPADAKGFYRDENGETPVFVGYAAVWNSLSVDLGGFREIVRSECFDASLAADADVRFLINHETWPVLGRTTAGTLTLGTDERGLRVECPLPDLSTVRDLTISMDRGDINQMSFGFRAREDAWEERDAESGLPIRDLVRADLFDVSVVTFPAYPETTAEVRAHAAEIASSADLRERAALADEKLAPVTDPLAQRAEPQAAIPPDPVEIVEPETPEAERSEPDPVLLLEALTALSEDLATREGKVLSAKTKGLLSDVQSQVNSASAALQGLLDATAEEDPAVGVASAPGEAQETRTLEELLLAYAAGTADSAFGGLVPDELVRDAADWLHANPDAPIAQDLRVSLMLTAAGNAALEAPRDLEVVERGMTRPNFIAFRKWMLAEGRDWGYDDDWQVYCLTQMIALGSSFMADESWEGKYAALDEEGNAGESALKSEADVSDMAGLLAALSVLLASEIGEAVSPRSVRQAPAPPVDAEAEAESRRRKLELLELELAVESAV